MQEDASTAGSPADSVWGAAGWGGWPGYSYGQTAAMQWAQYGQMMAAAAAGKGFGKGGKGKGFGKGKGKGKGYGKSGYKGGANAYAAQSNYMSQYC